MTNLDRLAEMWADLDPVDDWRPHIRDAIEEITRLRAALAAPSVPSVPVAYMMINKMHQLAPSLHFAPQEWHPSWEAVPLYTAPEAP
jgi:hypothetical protein